MHIRTLENLEDALDAALAWRKKELSALLAGIRSANGQQRQLQLRAGIALLYAHWEGFIKNAADSYIEYVASKRLTCDQLSSNFTALALGKLINEAKDSKRVSHRVAVVDFLRNEAGAGVTVPTKGVNAGSNLNSVVLGDIIAIVGVDVSPYVTKANLIDEALLGARNRIAHGEFLEVDADRYKDLHDEMLALMQLFRNQISNAATLSSYRRYPAPPAS